MRVRLLSVGMLAALVLAALASPSPAGSSKNKTWKAGQTVRWTWDKRGRWDGPKARLRFRVPAKTVFNGVYKSNGRYMTMGVLRPADEMGTYFGVVGTSVRAPSLRVAVRTALTLPHWTEVGAKRARVAASGRARGGARWYLVRYQLRGKRRYLLWFFNRRLVRNGQYWGTRLPAGIKARFFGGPAKAQRFGRSVLLAKR